MNSTLELIGKTGYVHFGALSFSVVILDIKNSYGVDRVLVQPVAGDKASAWINLTKLTDIE